MSRPRLESSLERIHAIRETLGKIADEARALEREMGAETVEQWAERGDDADTSDLEDAQTKLDELAIVLRGLRWAAESASDHVQREIARRSEVAA